MSSDQVPGAPSFGDLFDDPDAPPSTAAAAPVVTTPAPAPPEPGHEGTAQQPSAEPEHAPEDSSAPIEAPDEDGPAAPGAAATGSPDAAPADDDPLEVVAIGSGTAAAGAWDGTVEPGASAAPAGRVDTGRLYRSAGAEGPATLDAIPAIDPSYVPRPATAPAPTGTAAPSGDKAVVPGPGAGLTYTGVVVVVTAATVLVAFAEALLTDKIGAITGVALAVSSVYAALVVRRPDIWAAVVVPPLAFLVATLTAGQLTLDASGSLVVREAYMIFRTLAVNAPWILGTTVVCLAIVLVRRARS